jgi:hypothetical protein
MLIRIPPPWFLPEREATPEKVFDDRRTFIRKLGLAAIGTGAAAIAGAAPAKRTTRKTSAARIPTADL